MLIRKTLILSVLLGTTTSLFAQGIILNDQNLRTDLNWLNQQSVIQISTSTWPMSADQIQKALSKANIKNSTQQHVLDSVLAELKNKNIPLKINLFAESDSKNIPQNFGDIEKAQYVAGLEWNTGGENWDAQLRVNGEKDPQIDNNQDVNVEGSYIAGKLWNQWLIAGQIPTYWGPGHDGSLIRGDASRPVYGFTAQRADQAAFETKWLSWIGAWQYQIFAGKLDDYSAIPDTKLIGLRVTAQPLPYLELAASRALQWGGDGRPESFSSLVDAIVGNKDNGGTGEPDPSNQIAGFDARLNLKEFLDFPMSVYGQYVGEDEAGSLPAKKLYLAGMDYSSSFKKMPYQLYAEWADTRTNGKSQGISYAHSVYKDGYYQHGFPLGHSLGGDGEMISLGGDVRLDTMNRLNGRLLFAKVNQSNRTINAAFPEKDNIKAFDLTWSHDLKSNISIKVNGWLSDSEKTGKDGGASLGLQLPLDKTLFKY